MSNLRQPLTYRQPFHWVAREYSSWLGVPDNDSATDASALPLSYARGGSPGRRDSNPQPLDPESKEPSPALRARRRVAERPPDNESAAVLRELNPPTLRGRSYQVK